MSFSFAPLWKQILSNSSQRYHNFRIDHVRVFRLFAIGGPASRYPEIRQVLVTSLAVLDFPLTNYIAVVSLCLFLIVGIYTRRVPNRRLYCMAASVVTPFIGLIALSMIENSPATKWTKWV